MQPAWLATFAAGALLWARPAAGLGTRLPGDTAGGVFGAARAVTRAASDTLVGRRARPEVLGVVIEGAHAVTAGEIQNSITTTASRCRGVLLWPFCLISKAPYFYQRFYLDRDELKRDVIRIRVLYWLRGYRLASVDTAITPPRGRTARVTFMIHEGPATRVTSVTVTPETLFVLRMLQRLVRVRVGDPLDLNKLDTSAVALRERLWARGNADATVDTTVRLSGQPPDDSVSRALAAEGHISAGSATVTITMTPHRRTTVDTVIVRGNQNISAQTIRHAIPLRSNSLFLRNDVEASQRALFQTNLFRSARVTVDTTTGKPDSAKEAVVTVLEGPTRETSAGAGFTTADFFSFSSRFTNYNWVGGARVLVLDGALGNLFAHALYGVFNNGYKLVAPGTDLEPFLSPTWLLGANVTQPWFLGAENSLTLGINAHRRLAPGVFIDQGAGANIAFKHDLAPRAPLTIGYRYEVSHVTAGDAYFCVDYSVCDEATRDALLSRSRRSPVLVGAEIDRTNDAINPTAGFVLHSEFDYASQYTLSDYLYDRLYVTGSLFRPVYRSVIAFNARAGFVNPLGHGISGDTSGKVLHPSVRFYAGGASSVRGFGENQLGPQVLTIPPNVLRGTQNECPTNIPIQQCRVNGVPYLNNSDFTPQALGGYWLLEGTVEYRFPIYKALGGTVFVDGGMVGQSTVLKATCGASAITPGAGLRYMSIIGPIRLDLGLNPLTTCPLEVLTETPTGEIVTVTGPPGSPAAAALRSYSPQGLLYRFQLNLSVGQAF